MFRRRTTAALAVLTTAALAAPAWAVATQQEAPARRSTAAAAESAVTTASGVRVDAGLVDVLASSAADTPLRVFVHGADAAGARASAEAAGLRPVYELRSVGVVAADGVPAAVHALGSDPAVEYVEADAPIRFALDHTHEATRGAEARTLFQTLPGPAPTVTAGNGDKKPKKKDEPASTGPAFAEEIDGRGISVAVIDSGVDGSHPFFARPDGSSKVRRNLRQTCEEVELLVATEGTCASAGIGGMFIEAPANDSDTMALGGHGTHVAGIVGGVDTTLGDGRTLHGAAPGADLIALGTGRALVISGAVPALQWVLDHHADPCGDGSCPPIKVVNNSWSSSHDYVADDVVNKLQRALIAEGITVVWAASNDGGDGTEKMTSGYGQEPTPGSIMVANYDDGNTGSRDNQLDDDSSRGLQGAVDTYPDVSAPGAFVLSACRAYLPVCATGLEVVENGDYNSISGTSMAAPHVAGIVAQLLQVDPTLTPAAIEDLLEDTAHRFTTGGAYEPDLAERNSGSLTSFDKGHGLVDVVAAVARVLGVTAPAPAPDCVATGPVATDAEGDATGVLGVPVLPNEPSLDVTSLSLSTEGSELVATVAVAALGESTSPTTVEGEYFDINFTHAGRPFYLSAERDVAGAEAFALGHLGGTTRTGIDDAGVTGDFDPATSTITVRLPFAATADEAASIPPLADGSVLTAIGVVSRRKVVVVVPDADEAPAGCAYTLGVGNGAPAPVGGETPPSADEPDATLARGGPAYTFSGPVTTGVAEPTGAGGIVGLGHVMLEGEALVTRIVRVGEAGTLSVSLTTDTPADFDLEVRDSAGNIVGTSFNFVQDELVTAAVAAGDYRIFVRMYLANGATPTVTAGLT